MVKEIGIVENNYHFVQTKPRKFDVVFRIGEHSVSLANFEFYERMSEETKAFSADLVLDGINVGDCSNDGKGGCANYHAFGNWDLSRKIATEISEVTDYCFPKLKMSLEDVIDQLASFIIILQEYKVTTITRAKLVVENLNKEADEYRKKFT